LNINKPAAPNAGGWVVQVIRVTDATHVLARYADDGAIQEHPHPTDLSAIPTGADVHMAEQWVQDLYSDDAPDTLAIPVHVV
jgi:hypothetical protein